MSSKETSEDLLTFQEAFICQQGINFSHMTLPIEIYGKSEVILAVLPAYENLEWRYNLITANK